MLFCQVKQALSATKWTYMTDFQPPGPLLPIFRPRAPASYPTYSLFLWFLFPSPASGPRQSRNCQKAFVYAGLRPLPPSSSPHFKRHIARCQAWRPMAPVGAGNRGPGGGFAHEKRTQSMVLHTLGPYFILFLPQKWSILWHKVPILSGRMTINYIPICLATSAAKSSFFFSRPSPVSKRTNFFTLIEAPLAFATDATYWLTLCLPSSAFT